MEKGWDAKGLLKPLWARLDGKRDELAALTGIRGNTLSAYNSGKRRLGLPNAQRIAAALGVTLLDLGAPADAAPEQTALLLDRLAALEDQVGRLAKDLRLARKGQETILKTLKEQQLQLVVLQGQRGALPMRDSPVQGRP